MEEEVFSFKLSLYPCATEGEAYSDTSKVDGKVTMRLGCIQIVYLHKFLMSLLVRASYTSIAYLFVPINTKLIVAEFSKITINGVGYSSVTEYLTADQLQILLFLKQFVVCLANYYYYGWQCMR